MSSNIGRKSSFERRRYYSYRKVPQTTKHNKTSIKRFTAEEYEKKIQELLEKIDYLESRLVETGMDKIKIVTSHKKLSLENNYLKKEVKTNQKKNLELKTKNLNKSQKIERINKYCNDIKLSYDNKVDMMQRQLRQKTDDINKLVDKMKDKDSKILDMKINNDISYKEIQRQLNELNLLKLTNKTQEEKIYKLQNEINKLYIEKRCEGNLLMENKHLKDDNVRLVELLSLTEQFSDFAYLNDSLPGGVRYLNEIKIRDMPPRMKEKLVRDRIQTLNSWIPGAAYDKVLEFNYVHNLNMDEVLINELLYKLNQVFKEKEEKNIAKISTKYQKQILNIMDKYGIKNIAAPYNVLEVELVKKQAAKKIKLEQKKEQENKKRQESADDVANFTKSATSHFFWNHKKKLDEQISILKEKLSIKTFSNNKLKSYHKDDITNGNGFKTSYGSTVDSLATMDKIIINNLYLEKVINEINNIKNNFENLEKEYRNRVKDTNLEIGNDNNKFKDGCIKLLKTSVEWLINSMKDILNDSLNQFKQRKK